MNESVLISLAEEFLQANKIRIVLPGKIGDIESERVEVVFFVPEAIDPAVAVVDPPDVRVWVHKFNGKVILIQQM